MLASVEKQDRLFVGHDDTPFLGVSGRQVATIDRGTEIVFLDEQGPYTIVCWEGRNGYVPTDCLVTLDDLHDDAAGVHEAEARDERSKPSLNPFRFLFSRQRAA